MKILFVSEFLIDAAGKITGGDEARTFYTAKYLSQMGHEVSIVTSCLPGTKRFENLSGVKIYRVGKERSYIQSGDSFNRLVMFPLAVIRQGLQLDFDIVDGNSVAACPLVRILGILKRKKVVYWSPDILGKEAWQKVLGKPSGLIASLIESSFAFFPPDRIIALSETTGEKLLKLGVRNEKITVIYPGVENVITKRVTGKKFSTLISVQRLVGYKRTELAIKAVAILKKKGLLFKYLIIGGGPEKENLQKLVNDLGLNAQIKFLGRAGHEEVSRQMASSEIFTLPSDVEGFGIVTLEAMAEGVPFVNSDISVHKEIAKASQAGLLFCSGDVKDLAGKLEKLITDKELYKKLSKNALAFAGKNTWEQQAKKYENLLSH